MIVTPEYVRKLLDYGPNTGRFVWKKRDLRPGLERIDKGWNTRFEGREVGLSRHRHGHLNLPIHCHGHRAHRIAWMHFYGEAPDGAIDHINGDPADNRIANLRIATQSQNMMNARIRSNNTSGVKGVSWSKKSKKWYAYITRDKKMRGLGRFSEFDEAVAVRRKAEACLHGKFARAA